MRHLRLLAGFVAALFLLALRLTCRYTVVDDPRPALRARGGRYAYAILHAHQLAALFINDDACMCAMVSRSADGDFLAPVLQMRRVHAIRGSTNKSGVDKGGRAALAELCDEVRRGVPALLAVDGPRGPRNHVHRGIVDLAVETGAVVLPTVIVPTRRRIFPRSWDRFQVPKPFGRLTMVFGVPIEVDGKGADEVRAEIGASLRALERRHDPEEAVRAQLAAET